MDVPAVAEWCSIIGAAVSVGGAIPTAKGAVLAGARPGALATRTAPGAEPLSVQPANVATPAAATLLRPPVHDSETPGTGVPSARVTAGWLAASPTNVCPVASTIATTG